MTLICGTPKLARLVAFGMLAGLFWIMGSNVVSAQGDKTLRFGHMWPPTDVWGRGAQKFADLVKSRTNGKYDVKMFPSGQLGNEREMEEGLQVGNLDFTFGGSDVMSQFEPKMAVFALPFMFRDYNHSNAVLDGPVGMKVHEALRQKGIRVLAAGAQGFRYVLTQEADQQRGRYEKPQDQGP